MAIGAAVPAQRTDDPERIGPYAVLERLGHGGAARVFRAESPRTGPVAVKLMHDPIFGLRAVANEFHLASLVDQRFTAAPVAFGEDVAGAYLVTSLIPRHGPLSRARRGSFPAADLWRIGAAVARAIAAVHEAGVIHCDVKPSNLLAYGNSVRLIDFGISRLIADQPRTTSFVHFSRGWAAPEQLGPNPLTPAVDVFSWGCLMASLAGGSGPFQVGTDEEWVESVRVSEPELTGLPLGLDQLVRATLAADPQARPAAADLAEACDVPQRIVVPGSPRARFARDWDVAMPMAA